MRRTLIVMTVILCLLVLTASCTRDEYGNEPEVQCTPGIDDEDYTGPTRMLLGIGEGALAATHLRGAYPEKFAVLAGVGGPVSTRGLLILVESWLNDYDNWAQTPTRDQRLDFITELFRAFKNPLYDNAQSDFYPPGVNYTDFIDFVPKTVTGFVDRLNPTGAIPAVTFMDVSGDAVTFALALDENENGKRDAGEPILIQLHEDFTDANGNGIFDRGEQYDDYGIDGVAGTGDYGEQNGQFDYSPIGETFLKWDPVYVAQNAKRTDDQNYVASVYCDIALEDTWGFSDTNTILFNELAALGDGLKDSHCVTNSAAVYDQFLWEETYPRYAPFLAERFVWEQTPGDESDLNPAFTDLEDLRARRMMQSLFFLSSRVPNGLFYNEVEDTKVTFENHTYLTDSGIRLRYSIGLPAGYYRGHSIWETYPVLYVLPQKGVNPAQWIELLKFQGYLVQKELAQQVLLVILDPDAEVFGGTGYNYFAGPYDGNGLGIDTGVELIELMTHIETKFRANEK